MRIGRDNSPKIYDENEEFKIGKSKILMEGEDILIISYGPMVAISQEVANSLKKKGFSISLMDLYSIKPFDEQAVTKYAKNVNHVVTIEEHNVDGGVGDMISSFLSSRIPKKVTKIGIKDSFGTSGRSYLELIEFFKLTPKFIEDKLRVISDEL
jgi:transketolase